MTERVQDGKVQDEEGARRSSPAHIVSEDPMKMPSLSTQMALTINRFSHLDSPNDDSDDECNSELTIAEGTISPVFSKKERRSDKSQH